MAQDYRELVVWQKAIELTILVYKITKSFPREEILRPDFTDAKIERFDRQQHR